MKLTAETAKQDSNYLQVLSEWLFQLADDELTLGHRDAEWLGTSPDIEGDVAFSSIAQDEVGHALFYLERLHELGESDPDTLAFNRELSLRRNAILLERENGDWAYSITRHYFYDLFDQLRLTAMHGSSYQPLAEGVRKIEREEYYHLLHMKLWFTRLARAGGEAKERIERAVTDIWPDLNGLFSFGTHEQKLVELGIITVSADALRDKWLAEMKTIFTEAGLTWPGDLPPITQDGRRGEHTEHLTTLLSTMTEVYRVAPDARW